MEIVLAILNNPAVIVVLATIAAIVVIKVASKKEWITTVMPLVFNIYNMIEKEFPESSGWDKFKAFMQRFEEEYKKRTGETLDKPKADALADAVAVIAFKDEHNKGSND